MIDEAADLEARDEDHWMRNDAHSVEDCPECGGSGEAVRVGQYWNGPHCYACGGKGTLPRRDAERMREDERSRRAAEPDPGWTCPECGTWAHTGLDCTPCTVLGPPKDGPWPPREGVRGPRWRVERGMVTER